MVSQMRPTLRPQRHEDRWFCGLRDDSDNSLVDAINAVIDETGVIASLDGEQPRPHRRDGRNIEITHYHYAGAFTYLLTVEQELSARSSWRD